MTTANSHSYCHTHIRSIPTSGRYAWAAALVLTLGTCFSNTSALAETPHATCTVALLQMKPEGDDTAKNFAIAEQYCRRAAAQGADVALMPEMWNIGYAGFDPKVAGAREAFQAKAIAKDSKAVQRFSALAKELNMAIVVTYLQQWKPAPRNSLTLFDRHGREVFTYSKIHTCDFCAMEAATSPGDAFYAKDLDTKGGTVKVGAMICYDREHPESARILMLKGAEIILTPNACHLDDLRVDQFKVRAFENMVGTAMTNYPKPYHNGNSVAYDATGECVVRAGQEDGIFIAKFDMTDIRAHRASAIWGNAYRRPHRYQELTTPDKDAVWQRKTVDGTDAVYDSSKR